MDEHCCTCACQSVEDPTAAAATKNHEPVLQPATQPKRTPPATQPRPANEQACQQSSSKITLIQNQAIFEKLPEVSPVGNAMFGHLPQ